MMHIDQELNLRFEFDYEYDMSKSTLKRKYI